MSLVLAKTATRIAAHYLQKSCRRQPILPNCRLKVTTTSFWIPFPTLYPRHFNFIYTTSVSPYSYRKFISIARGDNTRNWALWACFVSFSFGNFRFLGFWAQSMAPKFLNCLTPGRDIILVMSFSPKHKVLVLFSTLGGLSRPVVDLSRGLGLR